MKTPLSALSLSLSLSLGLITALCLFPSSTEALDPSSGYATAVLADSPSIYYQFGDANGSVVADSSGNGRDGIDSVAQGEGWEAAAFGQLGGSPNPNGNSVIISDGAQIVNPWALAGPDTMTQEIWFKTSTTTGGMLAGYSDLLVDNSTDHDRHIYMTNDGRLIFGVYPNEVKVISSQKSYNDNNWHMAAATLGSTGMKLYVDGQLVASDPTVTNGQAIPSGYWRLGWENSGSWPETPSHLGFDGYLDEAAFWHSTELSGSQIAAHYNASTERLMTVSVQVDSTLSVSIAGRNSVCNGFTPTQSATANRIDFGSLVAGTRSGAQDIVASTNATSGYNFDIKSNHAFQSASHTFTDVPGTNSSPQAFPASEGFGYTTDASARFATNKWATLSLTNETITSATEPSNDAFCVGYQVHVDPDTPAGSYQTNVIYTVVPNY